MPRKTFPRNPQRSSAILKRIGMCKSMCFSVGNIRNERIKVRKNCRNLRVSRLMKYLCVKGRSCSAMDKHFCYQSTPSRTRQLHKLHNLRKMLTQHTSVYTTTIHGSLHGSIYNHRWCCCTQLNKSPEKSLVNKRIISYRR